MSTILRPDFDNQIRLALQNLHDFAFLQKLSITSLLSAPNRTLDQGVRLLRSEILAAVEQLNPSGNMSRRAKERRPYALLYGRYVQGMSTPELAEELAISVRQLRREQTRAVDAITALLWEKLAGQLDGESVSGGILSIEPHKAAQTETEQLISQAHVDDLVLLDLVNGVLATLVPVAEGHGIRLVNRLPDDLPLVRANRVVVRQGLMGLLSHALQRLQKGQIIIEGKMIARQVDLWIILEGEYQPNDPGSLGLDVSHKLIASLGGRIEIDDQPGAWQVKVTLPIAEELPILVMDDNAGMIELFRRYLAGRGYRVLEAHTAEEAIATARKLILKLVILDVMMPEQDGWEILQRLKAALETKSIPVMICSVLNEPEIASTLGASDYLPKPVTQDDLLAKVERWCRVPPSRAVARIGSPASTSKSQSG